MKLLKYSLLAVGTMAAVLGAYGAFQYAVQLDGLSYLALASPMVAAVAAFIPYAAERAWRVGHKAKSLLCWLLLVPTAAVVFFTTAERVHYAKAAAVAERGALRSAVDLAKDALTIAERKADAAERDTRAARAKGRKVCDARCVTRWEMEAAAARARVSEARSAVTEAEAKATAEAKLTAPAWLLPACIDGIAFTFLWLGLAIKTAPKPPRRKRKTRKTAKRASGALRLVASGTEGK